MPRFSIILDRVWASGGIPESGGKRKPPLGGQRRAAISSPAITVMRGNPRAARIRSEIKKPPREFRGRLKAQYLIHAYFTFCSAHASSAFLATQKKRALQCACSFKMTRRDTRHSTAQ